MIYGGDSKRERSSLHHSTGPLESRLSCILKKSVGINRLGINWLVICSCVGHLQRNDDSKSELWKEILWRYTLDFFAALC